MSRRLSKRANPDAAVFAACAAFVAARAALTASVQQSSGLADEKALRLQEGPEAAYAAAKDTLYAAEPVTLAGHAARAAAILEATKPFIFGTIDQADALEYVGHDLVLKALADLAAPPPVSDAELIALCTRFDELERDYKRVHRDTTSDAAADKAGAPIAAEQRRILDQMSKLRSATLEGAKARARTLKGYSGSSVFNHGGYIDQRLIADLVRDLAGEG